MDQDRQQAPAPTPFEERIDALSRFHPVDVLARTPRKTPYTDLITKLALGHDPRHVEGYMRIEHSTLDGLTQFQFAAEVRIAIGCIDVGGLDAAEQCARSYGL